jgi:hypothetical protein
VYGGKHQTDAFAFVFNPARRSSAIGRHSSVFAIG